MNASSIFLNWTVQFADINQFPDVSYCVDVLNLTSNSLLNSECDITTTKFQFPIPDDSQCDIIVFDIRIVNATFMAADTLGYYGAEERTYVPILLNTNC